ncbi:hypothetical protein [Mesorhizobium sp.]|uniref:hypothetical protein n=1 Tax=Mesorhizobium sp. TaxID=1871066 RepID=UPI0012041C7F|nr:hypothetical protein [Mesorhizobium sp.]TIV61910.1 MAG: hypothetical protein E5V80_03015 [Mesorhizobium sp.]
MGCRPDKLAVDDAAWQLAARGAVICPLAAKRRLSLADVGPACRQLGLNRSRICQLLERYRSSPVTSSLLGHSLSLAMGFGRVSDGTGAIIERAMRDTYRQPERPTVSAFHDRVRALCDGNGVAAPSWKHLRARVELVDRRVLMRDREGAKEACDQFAPAVTEYGADHALHIVQIDRTLVDAVNNVSRKPVQRPWLTLAIDVAGRMVTGFYLSLESASSALVALPPITCWMPKESWLESRNTQVAYIIGRFVGPCKAGEASPESTYSGRPIRKTRARIQETGPRNAAQTGVFLGFSSDLGRATSMICGAIHNTSDNATLPDITRYRQAVRFSAKPMA